MKHLQWHFSPKTENMKQADVSCFILFNNFWPTKVSHWKCYTYSLVKLVMHSWFEGLQSGFTGKMALGIASTGTGTLGRNFEELLFQKKKLFSLWQVLRCTITTWEDRSTHCWDLSILFILQCQQRNSELFWLDSWSGVSSIASH